MEFRNTSTFAWTNITIRMRCVIIVEMGVNVCSKDYVMIVCRDLHLITNKEDV